MKTRALQILSLVLLLGPVAPIRGQMSYDDVSLRRDAAQRILTDHGLALDWRKYSLSKLTDAELRLGAVKRIEREHSLRFDWRKSSLSSLTDAELRMASAKRLTSATGKLVNWRKYSLAQLMEAEIGHSAFLPPATLSANASAQISRIGNAEVVVDGELNGVLLPDSDGGMVIGGEMNGSFLPGSDE